MEANQRPSKLDYFMGFARQAATRGTCSRLKVGALVVRDDVILTTAYNGSPMRMPHCDHTHDSHSPCKLAVHAEMNAIVFAGREKCLGSTMYITHAPCLACSGPLIQSGIAEIYYEHFYKNNDGLDNLRVGGIDVYQTNTT